MQKLRTFRHPYVLTFVDSLENEESVLLVTESCIPLEKRLAELTKDTSLAKQNLAGVDLGV